MLVLEVSLDNLDDAIKTKRDAYEIDEDKTSAQTNFEVGKTLQNIKLPKKSGSPAFSIHADKVYILYPSLFQDPNIFGRFSIPQNVNFEQSSDKSWKPAGSSLQTQNQDEMTDAEAVPSTSGSKKMIRRQAANSNSSDGKVSAKRDEQKRNVETHLTGSIVVLNQDVNEINRKEAY